MAADSEATSILVARLNYAAKPFVTFVRLRNSVKLGNLTEVSVPVRFLYIVIMTKTCCMEDGFQIGRTIGTLMSREGFGNLAFTCEVYYLHIVFIYTAMLFLKV